MGVPVVPSPRLERDRARIEQIVVFKRIQVGGAGERPLGKPIAARENLSIHDSSSSMRRTLVFILMEGDGFENRLKAGKSRMPRARPRQPRRFALSLKTKRTAPALRLTA